MDEPATAAPAAAGRPGIPRWLLAGLAALVVALAGAGWVALSRSSAGTADPAPGAGAPAASPVDLTGQPAPATSYTTFEGSTRALAELRGSPVVLNFWASSCLPCVEEMPAFERVHRAYGDRVRFVGLAVNDGEAGARALARRTGVTYQLGFDPDARIGTSFGLVSLPGTVLIDPAGTVVHVEQYGALTADELTALIDERLAPPGSSS